MKVGMLIAVASNGAIGLDGGLPWPKLPNDLKRFRETTMGHAVIVGRKTFESMPTLDGRTVIVVTSRKAHDEKIVNASGDEPEIRDMNLGYALERASRVCDQVWICGGAGIYNNALDMNIVDELRITRIKGDFGYDVCAPKALCPGGSSRLSRAGLQAYSTHDVSEEGLSIKLDVWTREPSVFGPPVPLDAPLYWDDGSHGAEGTPVEPRQAPEMVNHPAHYNAGKYECIDVLEDWGLGFHEGNAVKYICRAQHKGRELEDLKKARWYLERRISQLSEE